MSDETPTTAQEAAESDSASESFSGSTPESPTESEASNPNKEAAAYRRRLRDTEAERDVLATKLTGAMEQLVNIEVAKKLAAPEDFWTTTQMADLLDSDGLVDPEKVTAAINNVLAARPHWRKPAPATESTSSVGSNGIVEGGQVKPSFADAFRPPEFRNTR